MGKRKLSKWVGSIFGRRRAASTHRPNVRTLLGVERFEERTQPSVSIPLNANTWTAIGPSPIAVGQAPGTPSSTGRVNGIAVDPTSTNVMFAATDAGGIWATADGGKTWTPETDQTQLQFQTIQVVHRTGGDTVYAFDQVGNLWTSTDGAKTFTVSTTPPFEAGAIVNNFHVVVTDPNDQTKDILFAAVGSILQPPPSSFPMTPPVLGSGIWRSMDGGATWTNLVDSTVSPFSTTAFNPIPADELSFSDVAIDPTNSNVLYAAVGNAFGDPTNGIYKTINALSATPTWTLLIGGSALVPGETPGNIKLAISPSVPSVVFASITDREDPQPPNDAPLLGVLRTLDGGANWAPVLLANPTSPINDPNNYMNIYGDDNNVIAIAPNSPANPLQQIVYLAGYGSTNASTVLFSTNSGTTFTQIGVGANGIGTYPNIHQAGFDSQNRLIVATGGGIYRLDSTIPVAWESLNGTAAATGLDVAQFNGFALNPTNANQAIGNVSFVGDDAGNDGPPMHDAVEFNDTGTAASAYGWTTVDANGVDGNTGEGQVLYDPFNPNIVYRVVPDHGGNFIRESTDGGLTWNAVTAGFQADPYPGLGAIPYLTLDPSQPNRLFSGFDQIQVSDNGGTSWSTSMITGNNGGSVQIPNLPTTGITEANGGPIPITAIGVGRESGIDFGGSGINGVTLFAATSDDVVRNPPAQETPPPNPPIGSSANSDDDDPDGYAAAVLTGAPAAQLWINLIPTNDLPFPPNGFKFDDHSWANITPTDPTTGAPLLAPGETIQQIIVDPSNNSTIYVYTSAGQVLRGEFIFGYVNIAPDGTIIGYAPDGIETFNPDGTPAGPSAPINSAASIWTVLTGNAPTGALPVAVPQPLALDPQVITDPTDDTLYVGTPASGVWKLTDPSADFTTTPPVWTEVGLDAASNPTMPIAPVTVLSLNTTTGILGAATYGRGTFELQTRGLISGHVFTDTNGNGVFDKGEPIFAGVTVEVLDENNGGAVVAATTTDATGFYQFRSLTAGNYEVVAFVANGLIETTGQPADLATFTEGSNDTVDLGFFSPASISGVKFLDTNADDIQDNGEVGLSGFTIYIDLNNNGVLDPGEPSTVTGANGAYSFTNLGPAFINGVANPKGGTFHLREIQQPHYVATVPAPGQALTVALTSGEADTTVDFGNRHPGVPTVPITPVVVSAEDVGGAPTVVMRNLTTNAIVSSFNAYASNFTGGVRVATAFFTTTSSLPDIVTAPGPGGGSQIKIFTPTGALIASFSAYGPGFNGGVFIAVGDVNGDGVPDIITGAGAGGGPHVEVFDGAAALKGQVKTLYSFYAYSSSFHGGVTVAAGDVEGIGQDDFITGAGPGGGPDVEVFNANTGNLVRAFYAYAPNFTGGVFVASTDVNGDGHADIITGPGVGGPHLVVFDGATNGIKLAEAYAFPPTNPASQFGGQSFWTSGLRVATVENFDPAGEPAIIVSPGSGEGPFVRLLDPLTMDELTPPGQLTVAGSNFSGGLFVAGD